MKASLSLKIALCLVLNLLLLGVVGVGFLIASGGFGWNALVSGPSGRKVQDLAELVAGEVGAAPAESRPAVLERLGAAYHVAFFVFDREGRSLVGEAAAVPAELRKRFERRLPPGALRFGPPPEFDRSARPPPEPDDGFRGEVPPPAREGAAPPGPGEATDPFRRDGPRRPDETSRRFSDQRSLLRTAAPAAYWIVVHPLPPRLGANEPGAIRPGAVVVRVDSLWGLLRLLQLTTPLFVGAAAVGLSALFWWPLVRGITRAIGELTRATEHIADGRFETRVPADRGDELGRLGESVNCMAARLDLLVRGQRRFLGDIAHELCSPLARLQMAIGILEERAAPELRASVADVRDEVQQMAELVNDLLAFTKAGLGPRAVKTQPVALAPLVARVVEREGGAARIACELAPDLAVRADEALLARAVGNLVRNAVRYAGAAGSIVVAAQIVGAEVRLTVADEGPGVAAEALPSLGEPFFRPEAARTREGGGTGLGLAIVKSAVLACGGSVEFANRRPRGFVAEIRLPSA